MKMEHADQFTGLLSDGDCRFIYCTCDKGWPLHDFSLTARLSEDGNCMQIRFLLLCRRIETACRFVYCSCVWGWRLLADSFTALVSEDVDCMQIRHCLGKWELQRFTEFGSRSWNASRFIFQEGNWPQRWNIFHQVDALPCLAKEENWSVSSSVPNFIKTISDFIARGNMLWNEDVWNLFWFSNYLYFNI